MKLLNVKCALIALFACTVLLFGITTSFALTVGLTPADITSDNMLAGGYAKMPFVYLTDSEEPITIYVTNSQESIANDWITYEPAIDYIQVSKDAPYRGFAVVRVPENVGQGSYAAYKKISVARPLDPVGGNTVAQVLLSTQQRITIEVGGTRDESCTLSGISTSSSFEAGDDLPLNIDITNTGNVPLERTVAVSLIDSDGNVANEDSFTFSLLPTERIQETKTMILPASTGQFTLMSQIDGCTYNAKPFLLDVRERGSLKSGGTIASIQSVSRVNETPQVPVSVLFSNTGEKELAASVLITIIRNGQQIGTQTLSTQAIPAGASKEFIYVHNASLHGRYEIQATGLYDGKKTYMKSVILTVDKIVEPSDTAFLPYIFGALVIIAILVVLFMPRR